MLIVFSLLITVYLIILLVPSKLNISRNLFYFISFISIIIFSLFALKFGYDIGNYKAFIDIYIDKPLLNHLNLIYLSNFFIVFLSKFVGGYNIFFTLIINLIISIPFLFITKNRNIYFLIAFFSNFIFFTLGNFKLGISLPIILLLIQNLLNSNYNFVLATFFLATSLHPQNLALGIPIFYLLAERNISTIKNLKIRYENLYFIFLIILMLSISFFVFSNNTFIAEILSRYTGQENIIFSPRTRFFEIFYQTIFLGLLLISKSSFQKRDLNEIYNLTFFYHLFKTFLVFIPYVSPYIYGRGLLGLITIDIIFYNYLFTNEYRDEKIKYGFRALIAIRLISTFLFGSLREAINLHQVIS